jgi:hypothetical protein
MTERATNQLDTDVPRLTLLAAKAVIDNIRNIRDFAGVPEHLVKALFWVCYSLALGVSLCCRLTLACYTTTLSHAKKFACELVMRPFKLY